MAEAILGLGERLARERRARLAAERLLAQKQRELIAANTQLSRHSLELSGRIVAQRREAESLRSQNSRALCEMARATSEAEVARRRLSEAIETIGDGFAVFDAAARLVTANQAYLALFGAERVQPGDSYPDVLGALAAGIAGLEGEAALDWRHKMIARLGSAVIEPEVVLLRDGRHIRFHDRRGEGGDLVSMTLDITTAIERQAELDTARASAEAASRAKSTFLANMSHEIRTPMNGVVGMAELLCETALTEEQRLFAETIRSSGEALLVIINDVLDFSKIEAGKLRLYPEPFDLERCLIEVTLLLQPLAREKGLELIVDFDHALPGRFIADPGRMRQVLTNLVGNAVKFTPRGHVLARVTGRGLPGGDWEVHVTVEDTGIGIAADQIEHIFGEFNQVEDQANRHFEGTGLGLAITRRLVTLMGGAIRVDSEPGRGSCFGFCLVLTPAERPGARPERPIPFTRALVVDADCVDRAILRRLLEISGLAVSACCDATEARTVLAAEGPFDVILSDRRLPGVRTAEPVVLLSAAPDGPGRRPAGIAAVLEKPFLQGQLLRVLQDLSRPPDAAPEAAPELGPARPLRVLAAEDNRTNQLVFQKMLGDGPMDLRFAANGREAVELWRDFRPDIVFMDISMPEMDGREAARAIRAEEGAGDLPRTPIVALTAQAMEGDLAAILGAGIDHCLTKPLRKAEMLARLREFCPQGFCPGAGAEGSGAPS